MTTPPLSFVDWNGATLVATSCQSVKVRRCTQLAAVPVELRTQTSGDVDEWWASSLAVWGSGVRVPLSSTLVDLGRWVRRAGWRLSPHFPCDAAGVVLLRPRSSGACIGHGGCHPRRDSERVH